mmetsp:Transcript_35306/g.111592  ORF Transcript_35306/g.111592 Transcript_35306/m.111592 type:complete len:207 (-) Transcript_35306:90-710(-)
MPSYPGSLSCCRIVPLAFMIDARNFVDTIPMKPFWSSYHCPAPIFLSHSPQKATPWGMACLATISTPTFTGCLPFLRYVAATSKAGRLNTDVTGLATRMSESTMKTSVALRVPACISLSMLNCPSTRYLLRYFPSTQLALRLISTSESPSNSGNWVRASVSRTNFMHGWFCLIDFWSIWIIPWYCFPGFLASLSMWKVENVSMSPG